MKSEIKVGISLYLKYSLDSSKERVHVCNYQQLIIFYLYALSSGNTYFHHWCEDTNIWPYFYYIMYIKIAFIGDAVIILRLLFDLILLVLRLVQSGP